MARLHSTQRISDRVHTDDKILIGMGRKGVGEKLKQIRKCS